MRKLGVVLLIAVIVAGFISAFIMARGGQAPVCFHPCRISRLPEYKAVLVDFEISNAADSTFIPNRLEHWSGTAWENCPQAVGGFSEHKSSRLVCTLGTVPAGPLRLVLNSSHSAHGLHSFWFRLRARLSGRGTGLSLDPFDKSVIPIPGSDVISEEFTTP